MSATPISARSAAGRIALKRMALGAPLVLLLAVLLVYPVGQLLLLSVQGPHGFGLAVYRQLLASPVYVNVLLITLKIALASTIGAVILGYPVAYLISVLPTHRKASTTLAFCGTR